MRLSSPGGPESSGRTWPGYTGYVWPTATERQQQRIINLMAKMFDRPAETILGRDRPTNLVAIRHAMWYLTYLHTDLSYTEVAVMYDRERRVLVHAIGKVKERLSDAANAVDVDTMTEVALNVTGLLKNTTERSKDHE